MTATSSRSADVARMLSDLKDVDLSAVGQDVEALAIDFVQQALAKGLTSEDIHDLVSEQILLLGGGA